MKNRRIVAGMLLGAAFGPVGLGAVVPVDRGELELRLAGLPGFGAPVTTIGGAGPGGGLGTRFALGVPIEEGSLITDPGDFTFDTTGDPFTVSGTVRFDGAWRYDNPGAPEYFGYFELTYDSSRNTITPGGSSGYLLSSTLGYEGPAFEILLSEDQPFFDVYELNEEAILLAGDIAFAPEFAQWFLDEGFVTEDLTGLYAGHIPRMILATNQIPSPGGVGLTAVGLAAVSKRRR